MARALRAWAINRGGKNSVRNLRYGPRTRLVRGMSDNNLASEFKENRNFFKPITIDVIEIFSYDYTVKSLFVFDKSTSNDRFPVARHDKNEDVNNKHSL